MAKNNRCTRKLIFFIFDRGQKLSYTPNIIL